MSQVNTGVNNKLIKSNLSIRIMSGATSETDGSFSFESDQLALRGNADYIEVLKVVAILTAQHKQAIKNHQKVVQLKNEYMQEPNKLLEKITEGEDLGLPPTMTMPALPVIDWSKYNVKIPEDVLQTIYSENNEVAPRKREVKDETKIKKSAWSTDEQKRLEELLELYPSEAIEMNRFRKIAKALGNRSVQQVTSRVQKYFMKLVKHGLPIPGRMPKAAERLKRTSLHKHQRHNHFLWKPTTFFPSLNVPVVMDELESAPGPSNINSMMPADMDVSCSTGGNYLLGTNAYREDFVEDDVRGQLELFKRIKEEKYRELRIGNPFHHGGFQCRNCGDDPIVGTRWHCATCEMDSIDFCTDCLLNACGNSKRPHPPTHHFVAWVDDKTPLHECDSDSKKSYDSVKDELSDYGDTTSENQTIKAERTSESSGSVLDDMAVKQEEASVKDELDEVDYEDAEQALFNSARSPKWFNDLSRLSPDFLNSGSIFADSD